MYGIPASSRTRCHRRRSSGWAGGDKLPPRREAASVEAYSWPQGDPMTPERLTGLDASFLYMETPTLHMHVAMAAVFDPSTVPDGYSFRRIRQMISERIPQAPVFQRRLVEVPMRIGH